MVKRELEPEPRTKITGEVIGKFHGLTIYGKVRHAKTHGRTRIWIHLRQADPKPLRVAVSLCYARAVDLQFEEDAK